jgi:hypothetical protein
MQNVAAGTLAVLPAALLLHELQPHPLHQTLHLHLPQHHDRRCLPHLQNLHLLRHGHSEIVKQMNSTITLHVTVTADTPVSLKLG